MAAQVENKSFLNTVVSCAKWTAVAFLGIDTLLLAGAPVIVVGSLLTWAVNGAMVGGIAGGIFAGLRELGSALKPKQTAKA